MKKYYLLLCVVFSVLSFAQFERIPYMEKKLFGFELNEDKTFEERLTILEKNVVGDISRENVLIRDKKLYSILFGDGHYYSTVTKLGNLEEYLFGRREPETDILTRLENIELYLYKKVKNTIPVIRRVNEIYSYLIITDDDFVLRGSFLAEINNLRLKPDRVYKKLKEGDNLEFVLEDDIEGVARRGSKVIGKVTGKEKRGFFRSEEVVIILTTIINEEKRIIDIHKVLKYKGDKKKLLGGKVVELDKIIIIG